MQNGKEYFKEFMKTIKEKVRDYKSKHLWAARSLEYYLLFVLVVVVVIYVFDHLSLIHTEPASARYMLSALVQSQAAIVAIVITLTLIAVQLTASAYSPRVIRIFRDYPDMWILLLFYGFSIFLGLLVLKMIRGAEDSSQIVIFNISLESSIIFVYALGISTFAILFLYLRNIMNLVTSENIINRLAIEITRDKILNPKEDPIQPIMDIIHGSIMKYDLETTRVGLKAVTAQVLKVIDPDSEKEISRRFCNHSERVSRLAISREDEDSTTEVIKNLATFGKSTAEKELKDAISQVAQSLGAIGRTAAENKLEFAASQAANYLGEVGSVAAENKLKDATSQVASSIYSVGEKATEKGLEDATSEAARSLRDVGIDAAGNRLKNATLQAVRCLGFVGKASAEKGFKDATLQTGVFLEGVGRAAVENELDDAIRRAALCLGIVGKAAAEKELDDATKQAALSLAKLTLLSEEIAKTAIKDYESELKQEQDRDSFQKFMRIYEQALEKLQPGK